jgi:hypothetical protein
MEEEVALMGYVKLLLKKLSLALSLYFSYFSP